MHGLGEKANFVKRIYRWTGKLLGGLLLGFQDGPGVVRGAGEKEHQVGLQFTQNIRSQCDRTDRSVTVAAKRDIVQASKGSGVFILLPNGHSQNVACNVKCPLRQLVLGHRHLQIRTQGREDIHANAGG